MGERCLSTISWNSKKQQQQRKISRWFQESRSEERYNFQGDKKTKKEEKYSQNLQNKKHQSFTYPLLDKKHNNKRKRKREWIKKTEKRHYFTSNFIGIWTFVQQTSKSYFFLCLFLFWKDKIFFHFKLTFNPIFCLLILIFDLWCSWLF